MSVVFIALGANLGDPLKQAQDAIEAVNQLQLSEVIKTSPFYRSKPLGPQDQPDYLNAVIKIMTELSPIELLHALQEIEKNLGRVRKANRWGPRTLDLDILLYDNLQMSSEQLTIPHYDMKSREFVLYPLYDLEPQLVLPDQSVLSDLITHLPLNNLIRWS
ncbi:2-amino-4-hydroxy-6-hydroxymethyldihydropteridine diphosphokinase [Orbus wheelerorum]|uniref:2-amino-4-hydroxy-6- hydroxymethyldihydropteridine diphosphokinase n=1 Tax=Orbus wheelerorum TaxID=3074111 RepID=UPI00370DBEB3